MESWESTADGGMVASRWGAAINSEMPTFTIILQITWNAMLIVKMNSVVGMSVRCDLGKRTMSGNDFKYLLLFLEYYYRINLGFFSLGFLDKPLKNERL